MTDTDRLRLRFVALAVGTIALGLLVHGRTVPLEPRARDVLGDALWAAMMAWWIGAAAPRAAVAGRSTVAYAVCVVVKVSQLLHSPGLDALRATRGGQLVLGSGYDSRDLVAYAVGVIGALLLEQAARRYRRGARRPAG